MKRIAVVALLIGALGAMPLLAAETTSGAAAVAPAKKHATSKRHARPHRAAPKHAAKAPSSHAERPAE